ncbi:hypothetical protein DSQ37_03525 [Ureaplasma urealyticum]|nr:hypothetical protein DSQ37_03525 [Ureaplasma urealyticum]
MDKKAFQHEQIKLVNNHRFL